MHTTNRNDYVPGVIVHVPHFPFKEKLQSNPRFALVISRRGPEVTVRGIYSRQHAGYEPITATRETGLDHNSFLGNRLVTLRIHEVGHALGDAPYDFDPFDDFRLPAA